MHFEIPVDDTGRAKEFYASIFDWQLNDADMGGGNMYTTLMTVPVDEQSRIPTEPGAINGGMGKRQSPHSEHPTVTIGVEDIDKAFEAISAAGGSALGEKMAVGEMGWAAYFTDSEGNVIGLWQSA